MHAWMLRKDVFKDKTRHFYVPEIDLFVSSLNHQVPLLTCTGIGPWCFSGGRFPTRLESMKEFHLTVVLLPRILQKVGSDKATALLVAPNWTG